MKKIIIVDGYNVINALPLFEEKIDQSLEAARLALARHLLKWKSSFKIYIVFDGKDDMLANNPTSVLYGIECIFTRSKEKADDRVIKMLRDFSSDKAEVTVISSDNYIRNHCRVYGAHIEPPSYLLGKSRKDPNKKNDKNQSWEKIIDTALKKEINDSLKKIWKIK